MIVNPDWQCRVLSSKPLIVAEIGAAHNGSLDRALALVDAAANAGADAVKFQTWSEMALPGHVIADGPWKGRDLAQLYAQARTPWDWHRTLFDFAGARALIAFSTPFDKASVDFLETLDCPMYKIASAEIVDLPLIRCAASKGKPMILSTGMATEAEIVDAVRAAREVGTARFNITVLKCTASYPATAADANLRTMLDMHQASGWRAGLSDHTLGSTVAVAAIALGASMIEKHIGLDRVGLDGGFCTLPEEFARFVADCRDAAACLGEARFGPLPSEASTLALRRSLWVVRDVKEGESMGADNVRSLRPAGGMAPGRFDDLVGMPFLRDVKAGSAFVAGMV